MFLSETYVRYQDDTNDSSVLELTWDHYLQRKQKGNEDEKSLFAAKTLSKSENNITVTQKKKDIKKKLKTRPTSVNYDADTDTDHEENAVADYTAPLQCEVCSLEFSLSYGPNLLGTHYDAQMDSVKKHKKKKRRSSKIKKERQINNIQVNFEEYKDFAHKMEEFDPECERKWTLEYSFDRTKTQSKLSKIIVGRGHRDDYSELNNIHLFSAVQGFEKSKWRNSILEKLKSNNKRNVANYTLFPTNNTCLFCFEERVKVITVTLEKGLPLHKQNIIKKLVKYNKNERKDDQKSKELLKPKKKFNFRLTKSKTKEKEASGMQNNDDDDEEFTFI